MSNTSATIPLLIFGLVVPVVAFIIAIRMASLKGVNREDLLVAVLYIWPPVYALLGLLVGVLYVSAEELSNRPASVVLRRPKLLETLGANLPAVAFVFAVAVSLPLLRRAKSLGTFLTKDRSRPRAMLAWARLDTLDETWLALGFAGIVNLLTIPVAFFVFPLFSAVVFCGSLCLVWVNFGLWRCLRRASLNEDQTVYIGAVVFTVELFLVLFLYLWWKFKNTAI